MPLSIRVRAARCRSRRCWAPCCPAAAGSRCVVLHAGARYVGSAWLLGGHRALRRLPPDRRQPAAQARHGARARAARRAAARRVRLAARARSSASRSTTTSCRPQAASPARCATSSTSRARRSRRSGSSRCRCRCRSTPACPSRRSERAQEALRRAKAVGEEYEGVHVADGDGARAARRRGDRARGQTPRGGGDRAGGRGALARARRGAFGGAGGPLDNYVGEVTKYVLRKASCRVILTAPAAERRRPPRGPAVTSRPCSSSS